MLKRDNECLISGRMIVDSYASAKSDVDLFIRHYPAMGTCHGHIMIIVVTISDVINHIACFLSIKEVK